MKKYSIIAIFILAAVILIPSLAHALPPDPGGDPDTGVPLDGGLSILLAAGVGYAGKKIHEARKSKR